MIIFSMISACFYSIGSSINTNSRIQPANALDELETGFGAETGDLYGWNVSHAGDLNDDTFDDMIVGAPGDDSNGLDAGAVYVYYGSESPATFGVDVSNADIILTGILPGDKFGWDVDGAGDVNNDGFDDIIVGAPGYGTNNGRAYIFYGGTLSNSTAELADVTLNGTSADELFGHSVAGAGNINGDNFDEVIVGGPLGDRAYIFHGQTIVQTVFTNLFDTDGDTITPETDFTSGINTTGNSPGYTGNDDGWDWYLTGTGPYGGDTSAVAYNADPNRDNHPSDSTVDTDDELIIGIGDDYGDGNHDGTVETGAYGVQFQIGSAQMAIINNGGTASISFDYLFDDSGTGQWAGLDANEEVWIKSRFGGATMNYLGFDLDAGDNYADSTPEVWWVNDPYDISWRTFSFDVTSYITGVGTHYLEFGGKIRTWSTGGTSSTEDGIFHFDNILLKMTNQRRSTILEGWPGSAFGSSVAGLGEFGGGATYDDVAVGAPLLYKGYTHIYYGKSSFPFYIPRSNTDVDFSGILDGELFGWAISGAGDINNDNYNDLIISAIGVDRAYVHFGKATYTPPAPIYPNLWDDNISTPGVVDFDMPGDEVNSNANTFGMGATPSASDDDGWDWDIGTYGQNLKGGPVRAHHYDPEPITEGTTFDGSKRLEVQIGPTHAGGDGSNNEIIDSAAWGVQINITPAMYAAINDGGEAYMSFNWEAEDTENPGSGTEERSYVKARFTTPAGTNYLGNNLGGDSEPDLFYYRYGGGGTSDTPWGPYRGFFQTRITNDITQSAYYYLEFGAKFDADTGSGQQGPNEGIRAYFDNVAMAIYPRIPHDMIINGTTGDKFGFSIDNSHSVNNDNFDDIVIGAPGNDNLNGVNSGAIFVFLGTGTFPPILDASLDADHINYGETSNESFGRAVAFAGSVDGDVYSEVLVGEPYKDSPPPNPVTDIGKVYVLSLIKKPKLWLNFPTGGEILSGEIELNATATDSDNNIDAEGVRFYYSTDSQNWVLIGNDPTPSAGIFYTIPIDTLEFDDSYYYVKVDVTDLDLNDRKDVSGMFTINNEYPPELQIVTPYDGEVVGGQLTIEATGFDSTKDLIGGGINETLGVRFYLSEDNISWSYLGNDNSTPKTDNSYQIELNTTSMIDGQYWLRANITDLDNTHVEDRVSFRIDNPSRAPELRLLYPINVTELSGMLSINATAFDMDNDINSSGVSFYYSKDEVKWVLISNDSTPEDVTFYQALWDTTTVKDDWYSVKVFVNDTAGLSATNLSEKFMIHNTYLNPPQLKLTYPNNGESVSLNVKLEADAFDVDDNMDNEGVKFYYSSNKIEWIYIGHSSTPELSNENHYVYTWNTLKMADGRYWLNATARDSSMLTGWDVSDEPFFIHNTEFNPPFLNVVSPNGGEVLSGNVVVSAEAGDLEDNIDSSGVHFYYSADRSNWTLIDLVFAPVSEVQSSPQMYTYNLSWDTTKVQDGEYWLNASATDTHGFNGWDLSDDKFFIHNSASNAPVVEVISPNGGEILQGNAKLQGTCFDLENNIEAFGLKFYYSFDNKNTWNLIGSNASGIPNLDRLLEKKYYLTWDTTTVSDGYYWLKAEATDLTGLIGADISDASFIIHNTLFNPPIVKIVAPQDNETVKRRISLEAEVIDLENNVDTVEFYYSTDQEIWILIGTAQDPIEVGGNIFTVLWNTEDVFDGEYWLKVIAIDDNSLTGETQSGKLFVENSVTEPKEKETEEGLDELFIWIFVIVIIIVIIITILAMVWNKKRKEQKIEETLTSITPTVTQAEIIRPSEMEMESTLAQISASPPPAAQLQAGEKTIQQLPTIAPPLLPAATGAPHAKSVKLEQDFQQKIATWKSQGYNVSRLEELITTDMDAFWDVLPIFINNINKLNELKPRFNALDTTGYEAEAASIRAKINEPDQALVVEQEVTMLESKLDQKTKLQAEEAAEDAKAKAEEAKGDFGEYLPTLPAEEASDETAAKELPGSVPEDETTDETVPEEQPEQDLKDTEQCIN